MGLIPWRNKQELPIRRAEGGVESPLAQFRLEMDRLMSDFFRDPWSLLESRHSEGFGSWMPSLDMSEDEKQIAVNVEIPGLEPKDIDISLTGHLLTIRGEKKDEKEEKGKDYYHAERRFGSFKRVVELPQTVDPESLSAEYKNGVLRLTAQKAVETQSKRIEIKSS